MSEAAVEVEAEVMEASQEVAKVSPAPPPAEAPATSVLQIIERAARDDKVDIVKMERLMAMYDQQIASHARTAYMAALSEMQLELPVVEKRGKIEVKNEVRSTYALWEDINEAIKPILSKHGFAISFRTGREADRIVVTGILSHREGHSEETTMHLPLDDSGSKNSVQAVGSSTSYGKRYTASALLNLTSRGDDDDGNAAGEPEHKPLTVEQLNTLYGLIDASGTKPELFCKYFEIDRVEDLSADRFKKAVAELERKVEMKEAANSTVGAA